MEHAPLTGRVQVFRGRGTADDGVSVTWNADKSVTMSVPVMMMAQRHVSKENLLPAQQQQPAPPRRHRNESYVQLGSVSPPPRPVTSPPPSRSLTHQVMTPLHRVVAGLV